MKYPKFTICIPNYNYADYLPKTIDSILSQQYADFEVVIADNQSADQSVNVVRSYMSRDSRIKLRVNRTNVGFAANLGKTASMATGEWRTMLSSDDLLHRDFLTVLDRLITQLGESAKSIIFSGNQTVIDGAGTPYDEIGIDWKMWKGAAKDEALSDLVNADVYRVNAKVLLKQSLHLLRTPFSFASTTYHRTLYEDAEGYCQTSIINPDKKFAWAALAHASEAIVVDKPLVSYRVHDRNQNTQQLNSGALKHLTDQYVATFGLDTEVLAAVGLSRADVVKSFVEQDIILRSLVSVARGDRVYAKRALAFGKATYSRELSKNKKYWPLRILLALGPLGTMIARQLKDRQTARWQTVQALPQESRDDGVDN